MPEKKTIYWNPFLETMPREKLVEIELKNFRRYLRYAREKCEYYRAKYKNIDPEEIRSIEDIRKLPIIDKEALRLAQEENGFGLFGQMLGVHPNEVTAFRQTSGTTGRPVYVAESYESWQWRVEIWCHILWMAGFRENDNVFVPFGYNVYVAFWEGHYAAEKLGCMVIPGGALDTRGRIDKMLEVKATASLNTPTYGLHMAESALKKGLDPKAIGIKRMVCAGEPLPQATRQRLENIWGAEVYDHIGGTEPCAWGAMCHERKGLHIMEPYFLVEILDMKTLSREVEEGELGVAVVTPLGRHSFPLIRFNTNDIVRKGAAGCLCGRTSLTISEVVGRADDLRKIRGVLFAPVSVEELLRREFPEIGEYEIVVERKGLNDEITLRLESCQGIDSDTMAQICAKIFERLKTKTNLRFNIACVPEGKLARYMLKSKRFKDLRGADQDEF